MAQMSIVDKSLEFQSLFYEYRTSNIENKAKFLEAINKAYEELEPEVKEYFLKNGLFDNVRLFLKYNPEQLPYFFEVAFHKYIFMFIKFYATEDEKEIFITKAPVDLVMKYFSAMEEDLTTPIATQEEFDQFYTILSKGAEAKDTRAVETLCTYFDQMGHKKFLNFLQEANDFEIELFVTGLPKEQAEQYTTYAKRISYYSEALAARVNHLYRIKPHRVYSGILSDLSIITYKAIVSKEKELVEDLSTLKTRVIQLYNDRVERVKTGESDKENKARLDTEYQDILNSIELLKPKVDKLEQDIKNTQIQVLETEETKEEKYEIKLIETEMPDLGVLIERVKYLYNKAPASGFEGLLVDNSTEGEQSEAKQIEASEIVRLQYLSIFEAIKQYYGPDVFSFFSLDASEIERIYKEYAVEETLLKSKNKLESDIAALEDMHLGYKNDLMQKTEAISKKLESLSAAYPYFEIIVRNKTLSDHDKLKACIEQFKKWINVSLTLSKEANDDTKEAKEERIKERKLWREEVNKLKKLNSEQFQAKRAYSKFLPDYESNLENLKYKCEKIREIGKTLKREIDYTQIAKEYFQSFKNDFDFPNKVFYVDKKCDRFDQLVEIESITSHVMDVISVIPKERFGEMIEMIMFVISEIVSEKLYYLNTTNSMLTSRLKETERVADIIQKGTTEGVLEKSYNMKVSNPLRKMGISELEHLSSVWVSASKKIYNINGFIDRYMTNFATTDDIERQLIKYLKSEANKIYNDFYRKLYKEATDIDKSEVSYYGFLNKQKEKECKGFWQKEYGVEPKKEELKEWCSMHKELFVWLYSEQCLKAALEEKSRTGDNSLLDSIFSSSFDYILNARRIHKSVSEAVVHKRWKEFEKQRKDDTPDIEDDKVINSVADQDVYYQVHKNLEISNEALDEICKCFPDKNTNSKLYIRRKQVLYLHYIKEYENAEIAALLGIKDIGTIQNDLAYIKKALAAKYNK